MTRRFWPKGRCEILECIGLSILGTVIAIGILYVIFIIPPHP